MSDTEGGSEAPWGYLLPLQDGFPPLKLRQDSSTVSTYDNCTLHVDTPKYARFLGLSANKVPQVLFTIRRERSTTNMQLSCKTDAVLLNGEALQRGTKKILEHGARIAFNADEVTYVFVNREISNFFRAPLDVLEEYLVGHCLGSGGFGKVYIVFDKKSNYERKAMKIVEPKNENHLQYAEREARILMSLKHPCVIETFGIGHLGQQRFLIMEYMAGGDLSEFVNDKKLLSEAQTKLLFFQLALAMEYLHLKNICHRDLKPANILLQQRCPKTLIKVTDFGLAKDVKDDSTLKTFLGSQHYLAPEIINDEKYKTSVDVWSMGVILFYSLTGVLPFKNLDESVRRSHVVKFVRENWRGVSSQAQHLVKRMLKVKTTDRVSVSQVIEDTWLRDDAMRDDIFWLTGLEHYRPSSSDQNDLTQPWGYLMPLTDGVLPLQLRNNEMKMTIFHEDGHSGLLRFLVRHRRGIVTLRSEVKGLILNGEVLEPGNEVILRNGAHISFQEITYVFVNRKSSESYKLPPDIIKQYLIVQSESESPFKSVHVLFEKKLNNQRKALKIFRTNNGPVLKFSARETRILLSLKHPCISETFSIGQLNQQQFLVVEYVSGGNLGQFVNNKRHLSEMQAKLIFFQLSLGVQYLHEQNICYCILRPENILLQHHDPHTLVKLSINGLLKLSVNEDIFQSDAFAGTEIFLAPEITDREKPITNSVDVWSMGVILFYSFTGVLPFRSVDDGVRRGHVVIFNQEVWRQVSSHAQLLVKRMLKVKATDRLSVSQVLDDPWLRDDAMREDAVWITGLDDIWVQPPSLPSHPARATSRPLSTSTWSSNNSQIEEQNMVVHSNPDQDNQGGHRKIKCILL